MKMLAHTFLITVEREHTIVERHTVRISAHTDKVQRTVDALRCRINGQVGDDRSEHGVFTPSSYQFSATLCDIVGLPVKGAKH